MEIIKNVDFVIYTIIKRASAFINLDWVDQPFMIYPDVYKKDKRLLAEAMKEIIENEMMVDFDIVEFNDSGMELDLKHASLSQYAKDLAKKSATSIRLKGLFGKITDTYYELQDQLDDNYNKFNNYPDQKLIQMVKLNNFRSPSERAIVARILQERGYGKQ